MKNVFLIMVPRIKLLDKNPVEPELWPCSLRDPECYAARVHINEVQDQPQDLKKGTFYYP